MTDSDSAELYQQTKAKALQLLARREHSVGELKDKLARHCADQQLLDQVLQEMLDLRYLSDERYAEMLLRSRFNRGHGPIRVRQELKQNRVSSEVIQSSFEAFEEDWYALAREVRERKFGALPEDYQAKAKQMRFLAGRGFSSDQIEYAFSNHSD